MLARLDGIDFRQTAPLRPGPPFIRPYGTEWLASETALTRPLPGIKPATIVRAGGLDQGNIGLNLADIDRQGLNGDVLFLAGSAINSIKDAQGRSDPALGAEAMMQALHVYSSGEIADVEHIGDQQRVELQLTQPLAERRAALGVGHKPDGSGVRGVRWKHIAYGEPSRTPGSLRSRKRHPIGAILGKQRTLAAGLDDGDGLDRAGHGRIQRLLVRVDQGGHRMGPTVWAELEIPRRGTHTQAGSDAGETVNSQLPLCAQRLGAQRRSSHR